MQNHAPALDRRFCVAPMMDLTDRHDRYLLRLISRHALLYTEMVTSQALLRGDAERLLAYNSEEHPVALQLGGSDPEQLTECCKLAEAAGYDEVNLNVGCPSDRVQSGAIGACLMLQADQVARCVEAMQAACSIPVTVKCRLGVDDQEPSDTLPDFIRTVAAAGCETFIIHARKAWLQGLSPKENREIPPLDYPLVYDIKRQFPKLEIIINGGLIDLESAEQQMQHVDGVMLGRAAYYDAYLLSQVDAIFYGDRSEVRTRDQVFHDYLAYIEQEMSKGQALKHMAKHSLTLFHGQPGARRYRRHLSEHMYRDDADISVMTDAYALLPKSTDEQVENKG